MLVQRRCATGLLGGRVRAWHQQLLAEELAEDCDSEARGTEQRGVGEQRDVCRALLGVPNHE